MSFLAANPAGFSYLSPRLVARAIAGFSTGNDGGEFRPSCGGHACSYRTAITASFRSLLWRVSAVMYPVLCLVTASGFSRRPAALGLLLRVPRPFGVSVPPKTSLQTTAKSAAQTSFEPLRESRPSALGSRTHSLGFARCDPSNNGKFNKRRHDYVPEQSNPHRLCRQ